MDLSKNNIKALSFNYLVELFAGWYKERTGKDDAFTNAFTKLSLLKLLFLTAATKTDDKDDKSDLLDIFDDFRALPYGPVESDVYNAMNSNELPNYDITDRKISIKENTGLTTLEKELQLKIEKSVNKIKNINSELITLNAFDLVEITHQWDSWISAYNFAQLMGQQAYKITSEEIRNDRNKFYGYIPQS